MPRNIPITVDLKYLETTKVELLGDNFNYITGNGLYLSGNKFNTDYIDLYTSIKNLSANNPPFSGIPVFNYTVTNRNRLEFLLPENLLKGKYDIIFCNPAGYFKASQNKKFNYINIVNLDGEIKQYATITGSNIVTISGVYITSISKYI